MGDPIILKRPPFAALRAIAQFKSYRVWEAIHVSCDLVGPPKTARIPLRATEPRRPGGHAPPKTKLAVTVHPTYHYRRKYFLWTSALRSSPASAGQITN